MRVARAKKKPTPGEKVVKFKNDKGDELCGTLRDAGGKDVVLMMHGMMSLRDKVHFPEMASALAAKGISSLRFDFSGNGDSTGTFRYANSFEEAEDIRAAVLYVRGMLQKHVAGLLGHSKGGLGAVLYSAKYDDVPRLLGLAVGWTRLASMHDTFGKDDTLERVEKEGQAEIVWFGIKDPRKPHVFQLTRQDVEEVNTGLDMAKHCAAIKKTRVLMVLGAADSLVPEEWARDYERAIQDCSVRMIPGGNHNFDDAQAAKELVAAAAEFFTAKDPA